MTFKKTISKKYFAYLLALILLFQGCGGEGEPGVPLPPDGGSNADSSISKISVDFRRGLPADGVSMATITVEVFDKEGKHLDGERPYINVEPLDGTIIEQPGKTVGGISKGTLASTKVQDILLSVTMNPSNPRSVTLDQKVTVSFGPLFEDPVQIELASGNLNPEFIRVMKFDADAYPDVLVSGGEFTDSFMTMFKGSKDGLSAPIPLGFPGLKPKSFAIGDFDDDDEIEIISAGTESKQLYFMNGPDYDSPLPFPIAFGAVSEFDVDIDLDSPHSLATGDFNDDGLDDLAVATYNSDMVEVFIQRRFADGYTCLFCIPFYSIKLLTHPNPRYLEVADVNGDGRDDIVVASESAALIAGQRVSVFLTLDPIDQGASAEPEAKFDIRRDFDMGPSPYAFNVADLNGDGVPDLCVANHFGPDGTISVSLGNGNGTFSGTSSTIAGDRPASIKVADLNGDDQLDIVAVSGFSDSGMVLANDGRGAFPQTHVFDAGEGPSSVDVGDLNRDGKADLAITNYRGTLNGNGVITILYGR